MTVVEQRICKKCNGEGYVEFNKNDRQFHLYFRLWITIGITLLIVGYIVAQAMYGHLLWWLMFVAIICVSNIIDVIAKIHDLAASVVTHFPRDDIPQLLYNLIIRELGPVKGVLFCELLVVIRNNDISASVVTENK